MNKTYQLQNDYTAPTVITIISTHLISLPYFKTSNAPRMKPTAEQSSVLSRIVS